MPPAPVTTIQQHPLRITELLTLILSFLDNKSLVKAALVSKEWSDAALDILWQVVTDFRPLLSLLAPLTSERKSTNQGAYSFIVSRRKSDRPFQANATLSQRFRRRLQAADWQKWDRYARRVRKLDVDDRRSIARRARLDSSVYEEITRTSSPRQELLPNLTTLAWWTDGADRQVRSLVFMHPNIRSLSIQFYNSASQPLSAYIDEILIRCPHLTKVEVRSRTPMRDIQAQVLTLVEKLPQLRSLVLPIYYITSATMTELAKKKGLQSIEFAHPTEGGTGERADVVNFAPVLPEGSFPNLRTLSFSAHLQHAVEVLSTRAIFANLSRLYLQVLAIDNPPILHQFFTVVSERFPYLIEVHVDFLLGPQSPVVAPPPANARPSVNTLRPLLSCSRMRVFELRWDYELNISQRDVEEIAQCWPYLEVLVLNCDPIPERPPPILSALALVPFARHCPHLLELSMYIDGDMVPADPYGPIEPFRALRSLSFGSSPIHAVDPVTLFLSQLLPTRCQLFAGVRWPDAYSIALDHAGVADDIRAATSEWWVGWTNVAKVLPLAIKARQDERKRVAAQHQELDRLNKSRVEDLETQLRELRSRMDVGP